MYDLPPCYTDWFQYLPSLSWRGLYCKMYVLIKFSWHVIIKNIYILLQWVFVLFKVTNTSNIYEEATVSIYSQYLWYKMQKKGINEKMVECVKRIQDEIQFCVQKNYEEINEPVKQETEVKQGCSHGPRLIYQWQYSLYQWRKSICTSTGKRIL